MKQKSLGWLGTNAPRYTSYPTAPHFNQEINPQLYQDWLRTIKDGSSISLYFHIPFCKKLCWFCGCHTNIVNHYQPIGTYLEFLLKEIDLVASNINKNHSVTHIHFGGGSPTILSVDDFSRLMNHIKNNFQLNQKTEISIEIDPRNIDEEKINCYSRLGVNRASIGVQDFNLQTQQAINRIQPYEMVEKLFSQLRKAKINDINIDLIYGLPHQTTKTIQNTLELSLNLKPSRIALFSFAYVPWIKKHQQLIDQSLIVDDEEKLKMFEFATQILKEHQYQAIGIDHFATKDDQLSIALNNKTLKRNFQGYTADDAEQLIGMGISAIGKLQFGYAQNSGSSQEYKAAINNGQLPIVKGKIISLEDKIRKEIIDDLMCFMEIDLAEILQKYQLPQNHFDGEVQTIKNLYHNIVKIDQLKITVTSQYKMSTRAVATVFDQYFQESSSSNKYSKVA